MGVVRNGEWKTLFGLLFSVNRHFLVPEDQKSAYKRTKRNRLVIGYYCISNKQVPQTWRIVVCPMLSKKLILAKITFPQHILPEYTFDATTLSMISKIKCQNPSAQGMGFQNSFIQKFHKDLVIKLDNIFWQEQNKSSLQTQLQGTIFFFHVVIVDREIIIIIKYCILYNKLNQINKLINY